MSSQFLVYLRLGFEHIADIRAYDHLLFVAALSVLYPIRAWRPLLILITAFTIGHSITLVLATLDLFRANAGLIETLIPVTIVLASAVNLVEATAPGITSPERGLARKIKYATALVFGLIHGLGFSTFLRAALGGEESIVMPLFAFNVGLEIGQILIVAIVLLLGGALVRFTRLDRSQWVMIASGATAGVALTLIIEQFFG